MVLPAEPCSARRLKSQSLWYGNKGFQLLLLVVVGAVVVHLFREDQTLGPPKDTVATRWVRMVRPDPTRSPTPLPTKGPTAKPTPHPTLAYEEVLMRRFNAAVLASDGLDPRSRPAGALETGSPTGTPTPTPMSSPTTSPTKNPTHSPTKSPTKSPTTSPTTSPRSRPRMWTKVKRFIFPGQDF